MTTSELSDLDAKIVNLVNRCWEERQMPLLLSRLGGQDNGEIASGAKRQAGSLIAYLRQRLVNDVQVIQHSTKPPVVGAIPAGVDAGVNGDFDALLDRTRGQSEEATPRFQPAFWAAFRKPLDESKRRYMSVQAPLHFRDAIPEERPDGFIEVEREYVIGPDAEMMEVQQKMQAWLANNKLEPSSFLLKGKTGTTHLPSDDLLGRLLLALEPDDLKRVSMPLDIVGKLRRQPL